MKPQPKTELRAQECAQEAVNQLAISAPKAGLEGGWTGSEESAVIHKEATRCALQLLEKRCYGEFGPDPALLQRKLERTAQLKEHVDRELVAYRDRAHKCELQQNQPLNWSLHKVLIIATFVTVTCTILALVTRAPWQTFAIVALAGVAMALRPWGLGAAVREIEFSLADDLTYFLNHWHSRRLARELKSICTGLDKENERRARASSWVEERMDWICGLYEVQRNRALRARIIAGDSAEKRGYIYERADEEATFRPATSDNYHDDGNHGADRKAPASD